MPAWVTDSQTNGLCDPPLADATAHEAPLPGIASENPRRPIGFVSYGDGIHFGRFIDDLADIGGGLLV